MKRTTAETAAQVAAQHSTGSSTAQTQAQVEAKHSISQHKSTAQDSAKLTAQHSKGHSMGLGRHLQDFSVLDGGQQRIKAVVGHDCIPVCCYCRPPCMQHVTVLSDVTACVHALCLLKVFSSFNTCRTRPKQHAPALINLTVRDVTSFVYALCLPEGGCRCMVTIAAPSRACLSFCASTKLD